MESSGYTVKWISSSVGQKFFKASKGSGEDCWLIEEVTEHQGARKAGGAVTFAWSIGEIQSWIAEQIAVTA